MERLLSKITIKVSDKLYLKDPETSELGRSIVKHSIEMINELGLESFTFKKLGEEINSPESSIYRYFNNKHQLLVYLMSWYWGWMEYKIVFATTNLPDPVTKLNVSLNYLTTPVAYDQAFLHVDETKLHQIVISESSKAYLTKEVDKENREGYYTAYKQLCNRFSEIFQEINPEFKHPRTLSSTIVDGIHHQMFFSQHIPALTDANGDKIDLQNFYMDLCLNTLNDNGNN